MQDSKIITGKFILLESIRGITAIYVMIEHLLLSIETVPKFILIPFKFGKEAVIIFFVLSGFVVHYSNRNSNSFKIYFIKRFRRIYGPVVIILIVTTVISYINRHSFIDISLSELVGNLLMLQNFNDAQPGMWFNCYLGNSPLWSLSFEWWFYILYFPILKFIKADKLFFSFFFSLTNLFIFFIIPNPIALIFSYFVVWWSGVELANMYISKSLSNSRRITFILMINLTMVIFSTIPIWYYDKPYEMGYFPIANIRYYLASFVFISIALIWHQYKWKYFLKLFKTFSLISPISFGLYIIHYPVFFMIHLNFNNLFIEITIKLFIVFFIAYFIEIIIQPIINKLFSINKFDTD